MRLENCIRRWLGLKAHRVVAIREIAGELVREMKPMCRGAHLMTLGWDDIVPDVLEHADLKP